MLTTREQIAAMALQGLLSRSDLRQTTEEYAADAVAAADQLLEILRSTEPKVDPEPAIPPPTIDWLAAYDHGARPLNVPTMQQVEN